jgi:hypothetical protein
VGVCSGSEPTKEGLQKGCWVGGRKAKEAAEKEKEKAEKEKRKLRVNAPLLFAFRSVSAMGILW